MTLIGSALTLYFLNLSISSLELYSVCVSVGLVLWVCFVWIRYNLNLLRISFHLRRYFFEFIDLSRNGFLISIQSYILVGYFLVDRLFVNTYFAAHSSEYALGFSVSQIIFIAVNTLAFSAQQKVGEGLKKFTLKDYNNLLIIVIVLFSCFFLVSTPLVYLFSLFLSGYGNFVFTFMIVSFFMVLIMQFQQLVLLDSIKMSKDSLFLIVTFSIFNIILSIVVQSFSLGYYFSIFKSGLLLLFSAVIFDRIIRRKLSCKPLS